MQKEKLLRQLSHLKKLKKIGFEYCDPFVITQESSVNMKVDSIDELKQSALSCHLCSLSKNRQNVVFGEGDKKAKLMIIGEAPGATEDKQGRPFAGRSGELLTNMIENAIGVPRESTYITNIIKCRPPANRNPNDDEAEMCKPFLDKQIEIINPQIILSLGSISFRYLTDDTTDISKARGKVYDYKNAKLIPSFHPSYLLRNPSAKKEAFQDMLLVKGLLN